MSYKAKWGNMGFLVSATKIVPFDNFSTTVSLKSNSENDATNVRGREPQQITFSTTYMRSLGMDPRAKYDEWYGEIGKSYPLYIGDKRFGPEKMTLKSISATNMQLNNNGDFLALELAITLEEYLTVTNTAKTTKTTTTSAKEAAAAAEAKKTEVRDKAMTLHERREHGNSNSEPTGWSEMASKDGKKYYHYGKKITQNNLTYKVYVDAKGVQYALKGRDYEEFRYDISGTILWRAKSQYTLNGKPVKVYVGSLASGASVYYYDDGTTFSKTTLSALE